MHFAFCIYAFAPFVPALFVFVLFVLFQRVYLCCADMNFFFLLQTSAMCVSLYERSVYFLFDYLKVILFSTPFFHFKFVCFSILTALSHACSEIEPLHVSVNLLKYCAVSAFSVFFLFSILLQPFCVSVSLLLFSLSLS